MPTERIEIAERFLQEAVFRSRARQAAETAALGASAESTGCGLGLRAAVVLDLDERGRELFAELFPTEPSGEELARLRGLLREWITRQDAFDRKRNHFLKDFRRRHGFDRRLYPPEVAAAYEAGLLAVNGDADAARRAAAERLVGAG